MIPQKKKTPEEIAALREGLGIPDALPQPGEARSRPTQLPPIAAKAETPPPPPPPEIAVVPAPVLDPVHPDATPMMELREPVNHLDIPPAPKTASPPPVYHSLRKHELPLAPAPFVTQKTTLPKSRHEAKDIAEIRRREALNHLGSSHQDPAVHLKKITAHLALLIPTYLLALAPTLAIWQRTLFVTPAILLLLAAALALFIFIKKKRSRHHAAIIFIIILMTLVFGGIHYAPYFTHGS
jgi:hypothetical protein